MPGHFKVAQKSLHGLEFFGAIGAIVSWNFVRTALEMRQNIPLLRASLAAMAAHPLVFGKVIFEIFALQIPFLVVLCCFPDSHCALLLPAPLPCAHATVHVVAPVHRFSVRNKTPFGAKCFAATWNKASIHGAPVTTTLLAILLCTL